MTDVLVICGPAGIGKSSVAFELSLRLDRHGVSHALIDTDELDRIYPVPDDLPAITERNLRAVWSTYAERGVGRLILVGVWLDRPSEIDWIRRAVPKARITAVRLLASRETLVQRVRNRERGTGLDSQMARTMQQLDASRDYPSESVPIATDGLPSIEVARQVRSAWSALDSDETGGA